MLSTSYRPPNINCFARYNIEIESQKEIVDLIIYYFSLRKIYILLHTLIETILTAGVALATFFLRILITMNIMMMRRKRRKRRDVNQFLNLSIEIENNEFEETPTNLLKDIIHQGRI